MVTHIQEVAKNSVSEAVSHSSDESLTDYCSQFPSSFCQALQASNTTTTKQLVGFCWEQGSPAWSVHTSGSVSDNAPGLQEENTFHTVNTQNLS